MKVREVIDRVIGGTGLTPLPWEQTCDRLIAGSMDQEVTRIGSTFMATVDVIRRAAEAGVDMIIVNGSAPEIIYDAVDGKAVGTRFIAKG